MIFKPSLINLYNKVNNNMFEEARITLSRPLLKYIDRGEERVIEVESEEVILSKVDPSWSPFTHELNIEIDLDIENPRVFFGERGVTSPENKIGIAILIYSKQSSMQETIKVGSFAANEGRIRRSINKTFKAGSLRGQVNFEIYFYLDEVVSTLSKQAETVGMLLSNGSFYELKLYIDGDGSTLPIILYKDPNGPLWSLKMDWVDASFDSFDEETVGIILNEDHRLYDQITLGKANRLLNDYCLEDIMVQAISSIISQVILIDEHNLNEECSEDSILNVVKYWIEVFEIDVSSLERISNTFRTNYERKRKR